MRKTVRENGSDSHGFTLLEIVIVMSILGIVTMIAIPNVLDWIPRYRLNGGARELYSNLQLARLRAVATNKQYGVTFVDNNHYCLVPVPGTNICASQDCCQKKNPTTKCYTDPSLACTLHELPSGIVFGAASGALTPPSNPTTAAVSDGVNFTNNRVTFSSNGSSPDSGTDGAVYLKNSQNDTRGITVLDTTGQIRLWRLSQGTTNDWE